MSPDAGSAESRRFEFRRCLGVGGFGEVYLARMVTGTGLSRDVAVKLLLGSLDPSSTLRLRDEARLLAALNHRAILQIHDLIHLDGRAALVTEYVDGLDLAALVIESGALDAKLALEVVGEVAGALHAALTTPAPGSGQPLGLVHRDIKPANIRLARSGAVKLLDFGIAVSSEVEREAKTGTGVIVGTLGYLAPERITEEGVKPPSDVYALGCVLYEALVGERLYAGVSQSQTLRVALHPEKHEGFLAGQLTRVEDVAGRAVRDVLERALAFDPVDRFTASELEQACEDLVATLPGLNLRRWARERRWAEPPVVTGSLEGRTIETTLGGAATGDGARATPSAPASRSTPRAARWLLPAGVALGAVVVAGVVGAVALGAYALWVPTAGLPTDAALTVAPPTAQAPADAAPTSGVPVAAVAAQPVDPAPPRVRPAPSSVAARPVAVKPVAPPPVATPPAEPAIPAAREAPEGTVHVTGGIPIQLRAAGKSWPAGKVPAGSYDVWADFGAGFASAGHVAVSSGATVTVRCSAMMMVCKEGG